MEQSLAITLHLQLCETKRSQNPENHLTHKNEYITMNLFLKCLQFPLVLVEDEEEEPVFSNS